jgi:hypothetical protein
MAKSITPVIVKTVAKYRYSLRYFLFIIGLILVRLGIVMLENSVKCIDSPPHIIVRAIDASRKEWSEVLMSNP